MPMTGYDKQERTNSRYLSSNVESSLPGLCTYGSNYKESSDITHEKNKVWIEAYGCSASKADSEMIIGQLRNCGYEIATDEKESSINLVVTCSVKEATSHKMLHRINSLAGSNKPIVIAGCLPKAEQEKIETLFPSASLLGPHSIDRTIDVVNAGISGKKIVALEDSLSDKINIPRIRINPTISIVEIASGCMSECTFCQTRVAKGRIRSYRIGDIVRQIRHDLVDGCKEIWLTSTDNGCYGKDIGSDLVELLKSCCKEDGSYKVRVGMMNPMHLPPMLDELLELYTTNDKIFKFLHIPVQSGSDIILRKMKRGHSVKIYRDMVKAFRSKIPELTIATDIIVGFPTETDEDFEKTLNIVLDLTHPPLNSNSLAQR
jgi:threonylcarbamoyladenosine tRNA methylthiotransferase CDKAL1